MRFVWAVLAFVLAAVLVGAGIAQRTIFLGPKNVKTEVSVDEPQRYTLIDSAVLRSHTGEQTLVVHGDGTLFAAQARTADLESWLADVPYNRVSLDDTGAVVTEAVEPPKEVTEPVEGDQTGDPAAADAGAPEDGGRNPAGSDLWLDEMSDETALIDRMQVPEGVSVLIASDGVADAPSDVVVSWPLPTATPWAGPLMVAGGVFLLAGLVLYVLAVRHSRRGRGPRRKSPPPLPTEPIEVARRTGAIEVGSETTAPEGPRRAESRAHRRPWRALMVIPAVGVSAALLSGCSPDAWPQAEPTATPTPTATATPDPTQQMPAVTGAQASRILQNLSKTLATADETLDGELAGTRLTGAALAERTTAYAARAAVADYGLPATIPADDIRILVPQAYDDWPRTTLMLVEHGTDQTVAPLILTMTQDDPWSNYKVSYVAEMQASAELPDMAPEWLGAKLTPPDSPFLEIAPDAIGEAFADVIDAGDQSASSGLFDQRAQDFAQSVVDSRAALVQKLADAGASETSAYSFDAIPGGDAPVAISSIDSGSIVAVTIKDAQTIAPTQEGVDIRPNAVAKALTGTESSTTGYVTTYSMQLFFSVPAQGATEPIALLAASQHLLSVEAIP
ncbi:hypothetical protein GCM10025768_25130 [Microbacterium pseudoresistens]|uniref:DUF8094 domain-containing protein n=1 Tax=Microbacterium pseudoresistens TaxID=640634 RepID=A0A7Y9EWL4_9MICO|nr:glycosyl transferase [Microbacterium pseudoresistens]NYD55278.1 hypothetical protein [Microbacterium pseudoresistens]